jgi:hypothetical protein
LLFCDGSSAFSDVFQLFINIKYCLYFVFQTPAQSTQPVWKFPVFLSSYRNTLVSVPIPLVLIELYINTENVLYLLNTVTTLYRQSCNILVTFLLYHDCIRLVIEQSCNKSRNATKLVTTTRNKQCEHNLMKRWCIVLVNG